jgi:hypothetical protein
LQIIYAIVAKSGFFRPARSLQIVGAFPLSPLENSMNASNDNAPEFQLPNLAESANGKSRVKDILEPFYASLEKESMQDGFLGRIIPVPLEGNDQ